MADHQTQANLALFIGETYCEIEVRSLDNKTLFYKQVFLPQTSLKSALQLLNPEITKLNYFIQDTYIVCRYLERLKTFRLGGSVIQITHKGLENNYTVENTMRFSLAASSLIIPIEENINSTELKNYLTTEFERTRKINPEANKIVLNLDQNLISTENFNFIEAFFKEKNFKIFKNLKPQDLNSIRRVLLNAGTEGTKEELMKEIQETFPQSHIHFWSGNKFNTKIENFELYFSSNDFLGSLCFSDQIKKIIFLDVENWMVLQKETLDVWDSPWGKINRPHYENAKLSLHPLTEILIDENSFLQFSKIPAASEPGPMTAGRGVKSLLLDTFYADMKIIDNMASLFPALQNANTANKIQSQFKVLEHGQKTESKTLKHEDIKSFIQELVQFDISRLGCTPENSVCLGNMSFLYKPHSEFKPFQWTNEIYKKIPLSKVNS